MEPTSPAALPSNEPVPDYAALVVLRFDAEGVYHCAYGPGLARVGLKDGELVGQRMQEVFSEDMDLLRAWDRLARGEAVQEWVRVAGVRWWLDARPDIGPDGELRWVDGVCYPEAQKRPEPVPKPDSRVWIWELSGSAYGFESMTRFMDEEGRREVPYMGKCPRSTFERMKQEGRLHLIRDSSYSRPGRPPTLVVLR